MRSNPSYFQEDDHPVESVSWHDANKFCETLTRILKKSGRLAGGYEFRLPKEIEWEYVARGGRQFEYSTSTGEINHDVVNFMGTICGDKWKATSPVISFPSNPYGIYDMSGNVWEWCEDAYRADYDNGKIIDSSIENKNSLNAPRVVRGGAWDSPTRDCRAASRYYYESDYAYINLGFRVVLATTAH